MESLLKAWQGKSLELLHQNVEEVLRSYRHSSDILSELLQNSVDACLRKKEALENYNPEISIEIDTNENIVIVEDNGEGIPYDKLYDIIIPGGSLKKLGNTYGYKGYGLTFLAFISKEINIKTLHNGKAYEIQFNNLFDWLLNPSKNENNLKPTKYEKLENLSNLKETFTKVSLKLPIGKYKENFPVLSSFDDFFEWVKEIKILEFVLRTRTAMGNVKAAMNEDFTKINFRVNLDGSIYEIPYEFLEPLESMYMKGGRTFSLQEYIKNVFCEPRLGDKSYRGLYEIKKDVKIGKNKQIFFNAKIYICGRTAITKLNEEFQLPKVSNKISENFDLNTGVYLSIDGLPTGIKIDNWASKGASWQRYFILVDILDKTFSEQLDSGRKGISNYFATKIVEKIEEIIVKEKFDIKCSVTPYTLQKLSKYLSVKDDTDSFIDEENSNDINEIIDRWKKQKEINFDFKSIIKEPMDENAVIVIFYELIVRDFIKGYHTLFISSQAKYDVGFKYYFENVTENDIFNEEINPLGLNPSFLNKRIPQKKLIGEFKIRLEDLLYDFDKNIKDITELDISIVWDFSREKIDELEGIIREENPYGRKYYGVTHILTYRNKDLPIICLKSLIEKIKDIS